MAGIGFELRKLLRRDDLLGILQGYGHSALAATGPWLITILTLAGVTFLGRSGVQPDDLFEFRLIVIYNFAFSLVMTGPIVMVATRYLADAIYAKKVEEASSMMLEYLLIIFGIGAVTVVPIYLFYARFSRVVALLAIVNFFVVSAIWLISAFLSALKNYADITKSFVIGALAALSSAALLARWGSGAAMILGFTLGLALILFSLIARVLVEYPYPVANIFRYGKYFRDYWQLALSGLIYNMAIWVDKWVMWFAPQREQLRSGLPMYPDYDSAMFLAYLAIVPSIAAFVMTIETDFFESYLRFYRGIQNHASYSEILDTQDGIIASILRGARTLIVPAGKHLPGHNSDLTKTLRPPAHRLQRDRHIPHWPAGSVFSHTAVGVHYRAFLFRPANNNSEDHVYFLLSNALFSYVTMRMGYSYYGFGYFMSALTTFGFAFLAIAHHLGRLTYQTFLVSNASIEN
jgi:uncharacterized membrane protein